MISQSLPPSERFRIHDPLHAVTDRSCNGSYILKTFGDCFYGQYFRHEYANGISTQLECVYAPERTFLSWLMDSRSGVFFPHV
ncbi:hypothetical protein J5N97_027749 [Dioscorea zingiberensis]|uniref:Uncharacterized protein n=1 Tax=Dioscorea zingiberensis TaxID=325984 RepID=A0A9D5H454_9LILI|nr:hypothetical protein J5N97_027749 [Dioscorea zingiberensis]